MIFEVLFIFSLLVNAFVVFYSIRLARKLIVIASNMETIRNSVDYFKEHVEQIHESEMFYGDQTLQNLINHSKDVIEVLDIHSDLMEMVVDEEVVDEEEE